MADTQADRRSKIEPVPFRFTLRGLFLFVLICSLACAAVFRVLLPAARAAQESARRTQCVDNLKRIGVALHSYHDAFGCFPSPYIPDADGKPMTSWRVATVPFLEASVFWNSYDTRQPWNSAANMALARSYNGLWYVCPSAKQPPGSGLTNYVMIVGPDAAVHGGEWTSLDELPNGAAMTVIIAEIADSDIFWSEPRDLSFDEMSLRINDKSKPSISSHHPHGALVLFADGSTRFIDESTSPEELRAMLTVWVGDDGKADQ